MRRRGVLSAPITSPQQNRDERDQHSRRAAMHFGAPVCKLVAIVHLNTKPCPQLTLFGHDTLRYWGGPEVKFL
jgi:hypothetical protein